MSQLDVDEIESRVRRRLAVTQARDEREAPRSLAPEKAPLSSERRLPSDGGATNVPKAAADVKTIAQACDGIALFQTLHADDRRALYACMYELTYAPGERVVRQGAEGRNFYVVVAGTLEVTVRVEASSSSSKTGELGAGPDDGDANTTRPTTKPRMKRLFPGDTFGEVALLHAVPRSATVTAAGSETCVLWALDRKTFKKILSEAAFERRRANESLLAKVAPLKMLDEYDRKVLADALVPKFYAKGENICVQGVRESPGGGAFHVIARGRVAVRLADGGEVNRLSIGAYFGEVSALEGTPPTATVTAITDVRAATLDRAAFRRALGEDVVAAMTERARLYKFDAVVASVGAPASASGRGWGGRGAANAAAAAAAARPRGLRGYLAGGGSRRDASGFERAAGAPSRRGDRDDAALGGGGMRWLSPSGKATIRRRDLTFHKELGVGMSGCVYFARVIRTGAACCVKVMQKKKLVRLDQVDNIKREKLLMTSFDTPFVMQSLCAFQEQAHLFLVMEYMPGGDLFQLLVNGTEKGLFEPGPSRFYAAEVLLALEYLHDRLYVYRDLKPENVLIAGDGHVKLADLGFCKKLQPGERTYTTCGTSDYMAPEVMLSQGYGKSADYWAFGVFVYEVLSGAAPFTGKTDSARHKRILTADLKFKANFHLHAKDLVCKLCVVDLSRRFGMMARGASEIKEHPFFSCEPGFDWGALERREARPPLKPKMRRAEDMMAREPMSGVARPGEDDKLSREEDELFGGY